MPSYDYKCEKCNEVFTIEKSMTDESIPSCPKCQSSNVKKVWGNIQFKGISSGCASGDCSSCGGSCSSCHH